MLHPTYSLHMGAGGLLGGGLLGCPICIFIYVFINLFIYLSSFIYLYHISIYICMYVYVHVCICMYILNHGFNNS